MKKHLLFIFLFLLLFTSSAQNGFISGGHRHSVMLCSDGAVYSFGRNTVGELGPGFTGSYSSTPVEVTGLPIITQVKAGSGSHTIALSCDSTLWTWGLSSCGQLGISGITLNCGSSSPTFSSTPVHVERGMQPSINGSPYLSKVVSIGNGNEESYAILATGEVMAWGRNTNGQLGNGTTLHSQTPVYVLKDAVNRLTKIIQVDAGDNNAYALDSNGIVWSWGNNYNYALGRNISANASYAGMVLKSDGTPLNNIRLISAGNKHGLALDSNGNVWSWGGDWAGQLGQGDYQQANNYAARVVDVNITSTGGPYLSGVKYISAGQAHSMALLSDGRVASWGSNNFYICSGLGESSPAGQLGLGLTSTGGCGTIVNISEYPQIVKTNASTSLSNIIYLSAADAWSFAINENGQVYSWGWNMEGELGIGNIINQTYATLITLPSGCNSIVPCPKASLGNDLTMCPSGNTLNLFAGCKSNTYNYSWYRSNNVTGPFTLVQGPIAGVSGANFSATQPGYYKVEISDSRTITNCRSCSVSKDTIHIKPTAILFTPNESTYCGDSAIFSVTGTGSFDWYSQSSGGTKLNSTPENSVKVKLTDAYQLNSTTYQLYTEDPSPYSVYLNPDIPCNEIGNNEQGNQTYQKFEVTTPLLLESVQIVTYNLLGSGSDNIAVAIFSDLNGQPNTPIFIGTGISVARGPLNSTQLVTVPVNFNITSNGTYWLALNNTYVKYYSCDAAFPIRENELSDKITITGTQHNHISVSSFGTTFNWKITLPGPRYSCGRVPVRATEMCSSCSEPTSTTISSDATTVCFPDSILLNASSIPSSPSSGIYLYEWYKDGNLITNSTLPYFYAKSSGIYNVKVVSSENTSCSAISGTVTISFLTASDIANAGEDQYTTSSSFHLSGNTPSASNTGIWTLESGSGNIVSPNDPATYINNLGLGENIFKWTVGNGNCTAHYDEVIIDRGTLIPISSIIGPDTVITNEIITYSVDEDPDANFLWGISDNGEIVSGQGTHSVQAIFSSTVPLKLSSESLTDSVWIIKYNNYDRDSLTKKLKVLLISGVALPAELNICIKPNPFTNETIFNIQDLNQEAYTLILTDISGKELFKETHLTNMDISLGKNLKRGVYLIQIIYQNKSETFRILKME